MSDHEPTPARETMRPRSTSRRATTATTPTTTAQDDGDHHAADTLGPIDWRMWGVGLLGVVAALIVVATFVVATGFVFLTPAA